MKKAMIRLEDVGPGGYYESAENQAKLLAVADYLKSEGVPFHVAVIPRYVDPVRRTDRSMADLADPNAAAFVRMLRGLKERGASFGMHGYTHQFGNAVSGEGYEFHSADCTADYGDDCQPDDSADALARPRLLRRSHAYRRYTEALRAFRSAGLRPDWFETPHYAASPVQRAILEACSGIMYETNPSSPDSRRATIRASDSPLSAGAVYVPTPLLYAGGSTVKADLERMLAAVGTYGDGELAFFFYHPFLEFPYIRLRENAAAAYAPHSPLRRLIAAFKAAGRRFVHVPDLLPFVPDFRSTGFFGGRDYRILPLKSGKGRPSKLLVRQYSTGNWSMAEISLGSGNKMDNGIRSLRPVLGGWPRLEEGLAAGEEMIGDFNGDGVDDIAVWHSATGVCAVALHTGTALVPAGNWLSAGDRFQGWHAAAGDWNGDGLDDLVLWDPASGRFATAYNEEGKFQYPVLLAEDLRAGANRVPCFGDVNGDGLDDIAVWDRPSGSWQVWINDGAEFQDAGIWLLHEPDEASCALLADIDGDGRADLLLFNRASGLWTVAFSTGGKFSVSGETFGPWAAGAETEPLAADLCGNGRASLLARMAERYGGTLDAAVNARDWVCFPP